MPASFSKVTVVGHLGCDPREHTFEDGSKVTNLSVATTDAWKDRDTQEKKERTHWISVSIFNDALAEVAMRYLKKGSYVYLEGQLESRQIKDSKLHELRVIMRPFNSELKMLDRKPSDPEPDSRTEDRYPDQEEAERPENGQRRTARNEPRR